MHCATNGTKVCRIFVCCCVRREFEFNFESKTRNNKKRRVFTFRPNYTPPRTNSSCNVFAWDNKVSAPQMPARPRMMTTKKAVFGIVFNAICTHTHTNRRLLHRYISEKNCRAAVVLPMRFVARAQRQRLHKIRMAFYSALVAAKTKELSRHYLHFYERTKNIHILFLVLFRCSVVQQFHNNNHSGQCAMQRKFSANENEPKRTNEKRERKMPPENKWKVLISPFLCIFAATDRRIFAFRLKSFTSLAAHGLI